MKRNILIALLSICTLGLYAQSFDVQYDKVHGGILAIHPKVKGVDLNYVICADGSQYKDFSYPQEWGVGTFALVTGQAKPVTHAWYKPTVVNKGGDAVYNEAGIEVKVDRTHRGRRLFENYTFTNTTDKTVTLTDIAINTPINDNYPKGTTCLESRVNAHIWAGYNSSYIQAVRMNNESPNMGLVLLKGSWKGYEINGRNYQTRSNVRGIISMLSEDQTLAPGESYTVEWELFLFKTKADFYKEAGRRGFVRAAAEQYTVDKGDTIKLSFTSHKRYKDFKVICDGKTIPCTRKGHTYYAACEASQLGEHRYIFHYDGKKTPVEVLTISSAAHLIQTRANFIIDHQQMNKKHDLRDGAYMVYDNETDKIYLNQKPNKPMVDHDEGAERLGMGVFLAMEYQRTHDPKILKSLKKYAKFVRLRLQADDYQTWSSVDWKHRNRAYNYPWVAHFYIEMYNCTGEKKYLVDCVGTMKAMYRNFGYGFYAIGIPIYDSIIALRKAGMNDEAEEMLAEYIKSGEVCLERGKNYPKHEVVFEQSIVAPYVTILAELYLLTKDERYLKNCAEHMEFLKAFSGEQPSCHLNDIAIRHWDGFWFGKRKTWGDTFPHYWSTITALAFKRYALCIGDDSYQKRAEQIVRNNLCQFFEDGRASCAYLYANKVNGRKAKFYDPWANDQDWALAYYFMINRK